MPFELQYLVPVINFLCVDKGLFCSHCNTPGRTTPHGCTIDRHVIAILCGGSTDVCVCACARACTRTCVRVMCTIRNVRQSIAGHSDQRDTLKDLSSQSMPQRTRLIVFKTYMYQTVETGTRTWKIVHRHPEIESNSDVTSSFETSLA